MAEKTLSPAFVEAAHEIIGTTPYFKLLGVKLRSLEAGRAVFTLHSQEKHLNPFGRVQGGAIASILDASCAWASLSMVPDGRGVATVDLKANYVEPVEPDQNLVAVGVTIKMGNRLGFAESRLTQEPGGRLLAFATATFAILNSKVSGPLANLPPKFLA